MKTVNWRVWLAAFWLLVAGIYVGNSWSPSSYAFALNNYFAYQDVQPTLGQSRAIRSDEWAVVTPLTKATVRNDFERYNKTSLYQEDLRINYGLPIFDWGLAFKPTMWLYGLCCTTRPESTRPQTPDGVMPRPPSRAFPIL